MKETMIQLDRKTCNIIFFIQLVGAIVCSLLQTALTTVIPVIMNDFHITALMAQWLTSAYTLAMGIMVPATAFLLKRFKARNLFFGASGLFLLGVILSVFSPFFSVLMIGRILQALGNGVLLSMTQVVILTIYPPEKRGSVMGIYGLAAGAAPVVAPTLAGMVADALNWRAIFWIALVIMLLDILLGMKYYQNILPTEKVKLDLISLLLSTIGFSSLLLGVGNAGSSKLTGLYVALPILIGVLTLMMFVFRQLHLEEPFLELRILKRREYGLSVIVSMLFYAVMMAGTTLIPLYIQTLRGNSATISGLVMMPGSLIMALISPFTGKIFDKFGIRKLAIVGSGTIMISCIGLSFVGMHTSLLLISFLMIIRLIGIGCIMMPLVTWGMTVIETKNTAHGTALLTSLRTISGAIGSAVIVAVMTVASKMSDGTTISIAGMNAAFLFITVLAVIQLAVAVAFVGKKKKAAYLS